MIFDRLSVLAFIFGRNNRAALERATRWSAAFQAHPKLAHDLIELGGVFALPPERLEDSVTQPDPICPIRAAREEGERALALKLLALGNVTIEELNQLSREP